MKLLIIGGGPGGYETAIRAAQMGAEVTLCEKDSLGGTCLNVGCIPTKALLHSADLYNEVLKDAAKSGVVCENVALDFQAVQARKAKVVSQLVNGVGSLMKAYGITVIKGHAVFTARDKVEVRTEEGVQELTFDKCIIASGSVPSVVPIPGHDLEGVVDSTGALNFEEVPASLAIIGGGVIGIEIGHAYARFGTKVTVIEMLPEILMNLDKDLVAVQRRNMRRAKIDVKTGSAVQSIEKDEAGLKVNVKDSQDKEFSVVAQKVLMCVGRRPATDDMGLDEIGVQRDRRRIVVDQDFRTTVPDIYAIGDCIGGIMLAHVASAEGGACLEGIMGKERTVNLSVIPSCVYTQPELAGVGLTEQDCEKLAEEQGLQYEIGKFPLMGNGKSLIIGEQSGLVKIIAEKDTGKVLGIHMAGPNATEIIMEGALALSMGASVEDILDTVHAHPTVSESMKEAAHAVFGNAVNMPPAK
ncbi:MAG: dihydrolipoyl dehydrogenase [Firmicutes bacterium]|nr:dihydrolipoyl dehydrogenase [Bacillota bacterium]